MVLRERVDGGGDAHAIVWTPPLGALNRSADGQARVDVGEGRNFIGTVIPTPATEQTDIFGHGLLEVYDIAILDAICPRQLDRRRSIKARVGQRQVDGLLVAAGEGIV